jgi:hypothetical protein
MSIEDNVAGYEMHLGKSLVAVTPTQDYISQTRLVWDEGRHKPDRDGVFHWALLSSVHRVAAVCRPAKANITS